METQDAATVDDCSGKTQVHPSDAHALDCDRCSELGCPPVVESGNGEGRRMGNLTEERWDFAGGGGSPDTRASPEWAGLEGG